MGKAFYYDDLLNLGFLGDLFPSDEVVTHEHFLRMDDSAYKDMRTLLSAVVQKLLTDAEMAIAQAFLDQLDKPETGTIEIPVDEADGIDAL